MNDDPGKALVRFQESLAASGRPTDGLYAALIADRVGDTTARDFALARMADNALKKPSVLDRLCVMFRAAVAPDGMRHLDPEAVNAPAVPASATAPIAPMASETPNNRT